MNYKAIHHFGILKNRISDFRGGLIKLNINRSLTMYSTAIFIHVSL